MILVTCLFSLSFSRGSEKIEGIYGAKGQKFRLEVVAENLEIPWGFDFLPKQKMIFTERKGSIKILDLKTGKITSLKGVPLVAASGQGGMLDVIAHPDFSKNQTIFFSFSKKVTGGYTTVISRAKVKGNKLISMREIFVARPANNKGLHFGSRLVIDKSGYLFFTVGDRGERHKAQSLKTHNGKVLRIHQDGKIPSDNPFRKAEGALGEIWSYGHRNPQGLTIDPVTGDLWSQEHGPRGGDEINIVKRAANYGWPVITYGKEYWGPSIGEGTHKVGMRQPRHYWVPSIAPSGLTFYTGDKFKSWKGSLFSGALRGAHLNRLVLVKGRVVKEERLLEKLGQRIRNVKEGPEGYLYISIDDGKILKLVPKG